MKEYSIVLYIFVISANVTLKYLFAICDMRGPGVGGDDACSLYARDFFFLPGLMWLFIALDFALLIYGLSVDRNNAKKIGFAFSTILTILSFILAFSDNIFKIGRAHV